MKKGILSTQAWKYLAMLPVIGCFLTAPAYAQFTSFQEISNTAGGFTEPLNDERGNDDDYGEAVGSIGDLDGDGIPDIVVTASKKEDISGDRTGAVFIMFLNRNGTVKSYQEISEGTGGFTGDLNSIDFGGQVGNIGDLDGDGITDIAIGVRTDSDGGNSSGAIWILFLNRDGTVKANQKISATQGGMNGAIDAGDWFGEVCVSPLGDFDGDGIPDICAGARSDDDGGTNRGAVYILLLNRNGTVKAYHKISSTSGGFTGNLEDRDVFGDETESLGDLDGDGVPDIAAMAKGDDDGGLTDAGAVWILFMNSNGTVKAHQKISATQGGFTDTLRSYDAFGEAIVNMGDLDGDGVTDIGVGADYHNDGGADTGAMWMLYLNRNGTIKSQQKISNSTPGFTGVLGTYDNFGNDAANIGDLNGDGVADLLVSSDSDEGFWIPEGDYGHSAAYVFFMEGANGGGDGTCPGAICDNTDTGFESVGAWSTSTSTSGYFGSNYLHDQNNAKGSKTASWTYAIGADGNYEVAAQWPAFANRATNVQYMYSINGGALQNCGVPVDQRINGGQFNVLCNATGLVAGSTLTVSLRNDAAGYVIADAVRVEWAGSGGNIPPVAAFTANQVAGTLTVNFDASGSSDTDDTIVSYDWDFDDGVLDSGVTLSHTYAVADNYSVTLTVTDDQGATSQVTQTVIVQPIGGGVCLGTICDNTDTGFESVGAWSTSTSTSGYFGSNYLHDQNNAKGSKTASWTYAIGADGNYEVAAQWSSSSNRATNVQYMYSINGGALQNCGVPVDQRINGGQFNVLCTAPALTAGSTLTVTLTNNSAGYVIADAVRVEATGAGGSEVCPGAICDNTDTGFETVGAWSTSTASRGYFGSNYLHDQNNAKGSKTASWTYTIGAAGDYEVAAQWAAFSNRATNAQYMYSVNGGTAQNCGAPVDQRINGGQFNVLCNVPGLVAGSTFTVSIRNDAAGYVIADAVRVQ
jgi:hypothetical protein